MWAFMDPVVAATDSATPMPSIARARPVPRNGWGRIDRYRSASIGHGCMLVGYERDFDSDLRNEGMIRAVRTALPVVCMISIG